MDKQEESVSPYLETLFDKQMHGIFVDVGAYDGVMGNYSYFFEKERKWNGLCIDGNDRIIQELRKNRVCAVKHEIISDLPNDHWFDFAENSGLLSAYDRSRIQVSDVNSPLAYGVVKEVSCISLTEIMRAVSLESIDLCCIDVMGAELKVMRSIDFEKIDVSVFVVAKFKNYYLNSLSELMDSKGYALIKVVDRAVFFVKRTELGKS